MHPLLKRILVNGLLTAAVLAVVGYGYAELAGLFLAAKSPSRPTLNPTTTVEADTLAESLHQRVPVMMAMWGFAFVAVGECVMYLICRRRPPAAPAEPKPDDATVLLEQILAKVEAERATLAASTTTSASPAENNPVAG